MILYVQSFKIHVHDLLLDKVLPLQHQRNKHSLWLKHYQNSFIYLFQIDINIKVFSAERKKKGVGILSQWKLMCSVSRFCLTVNLFHCTVTAIVFLLSEHLMYILQF